MTVRLLLSAVWLQAAAAAGRAELQIEVAWGHQDKPQCVLKGEVGECGKFVLKSENGRYSAKGRVCATKKGGYSVDIVMAHGHSVLETSRCLRLSERDGWMMVRGSGKRYSLKLTRNRKVDTKQDGARQPVTGPEAKPEGHESSQSDANVRLDQRIAGLGR